MSYLFHLFGSLRTKFLFTDRMLVQVSFTDNQSLPANFDEEQNRITPHLRHESWAEFIVAWRKDRIELYTDHVSSSFSPISNSISLSVLRRSHAKNGWLVTSSLPSSSRSHRLLRSYPCIPSPIAHSVSLALLNASARGPVRRLAGLFMELRKARTYLFLI